MSVAHYSYVADVCTFVDFHGVTPLIVVIGWQSSNRGHRMAVEQLSGRTNPVCGFPARARKRNEEESHRPMSSSLPKTKDATTAALCPQPARATIPRFGPCMIESPCSAGAQTNLVRMNNGLHNMRAAISIP